MAIWYKLTFVVGCKCDSKSICYHFWMGKRGCSPRDDFSNELTVVDARVLILLFSYFYTGLFEHVWDPLSQKQTTLAIKLIRGMAEVYPNFQAQNKTTQVKNIDRQNRLSVFVCTCLS